MKSDIIKIKPTGEYRGRCKVLEVKLNGETISDTADLIDMGKIQLDVTQDGTITIWGVNNWRIKENTFGDRKHRNLSTAVLEVERDDED